MCVCVYLCFERNFTFMNHCTFPLVWWFLHYSAFFCRKSVSSNGKLVSGVYRTSSSSSSSEAGSSVTSLMLWTLPAVLGLFHCQAGVCGKRKVHWTVVMFILKIFFSVWNYVKLCFTKFCDFFLYEKYAIKIPCKITWFNLVQQVSTVHYVTNRKKIYVRLSHLVFFKVSRNNSY